MTDTANQRYLTDTIDRVVDLGKEESEITVSDVTKAAGVHSHLTIIILAGALAATPISGIPGVSTFCGLTIAFTSIQALRGQKKVKLPAFLRKKSVSNRALMKALSTLRKVSVHLENHTHNRLEIFVSGPASKMLYGFFILGGLVMPLLEFIPFSASIMGGTITFFGIAALFRDGLWAAAGLSLLGVITWCVAV